VRQTVLGGGTESGVIYLQDEGETFYMLHAYAKSEQENLTPTQLRTLTQLVRKELK
jgi:hypothetical protein